MHEVPKSTRVYSALRQWISCAVSHRVYPPLALLNPDSSRWGQGWRSAYAWVARRPRASPPSTRSESFAYAAPLCISVFGTPLLIDTIFVVFCCFFSGTIPCITCPYIFSRLRAWDLGSQTVGITSIYINIYRERAIYRALYVYCICIYMYVKIPFVSFRLIIYIYIYILRAIYLAIYIHTYMHTYILWYNIICVYICTLKDACLFPSFVSVVSPVLLPHARKKNTVSPRACTTTVLRLDVVWWMLCKWAISEALSVDDEEPFSICGHIMICPW